jgi:hypothetical protein
VSVIPPSSGSSGDPEYLDSSGGGPLQPPPGPPAEGSGRRKALVGVGAVAALALVGGGAWAAWSFFATGPQPAEALPDSTLAYASIDLDPSGGQKIEALRTLRKFPAFKDKVGLDTDDDIRKRVFEEIQKSGACADVDYGDDVEPWLGDRMAVAAVDAGDRRPTPVFVVQVSDEDKADAGLEKLRDCGGDSGDSGAWAINDGWALIGESQDTVDQIAEDAADAPLSDDDDYKTWTDEAGDAGIASFYAAPEAGEALADNLDRLAAPLEGIEGELTDPGVSSDYGVPTPLRDALEDFEGMAATVRFDDGALEIEVAADAGKSGRTLVSDAGGEVLSTLPDDTAAAMGVGFSEGWFSDLVDQMSTSFGSDMSSEDLMRELSDQSGLDLPDDAETLAGDSAALAVGSDFDPETFFNSDDGSGVPVGVKVQGDPDAIESVLDKLRPRLGGADRILDSDAEGDMVAIGPDDGYRSQLLEDGDLGGSDVFRNVVREADQAAAVLFVNFDAGEGWLAESAGDDPEAKENLEPLEGLGLSGWQDGDTSHGVLRITTD